MNKQSRSAVTILWALVAAAAAAFCLLGDGSDSGAFGSDGGPLQPAARFLADQRQEESKSARTAEEASLSSSIVWCHVGENLQHGDHIVHSLRNARIWNPTGVRLVLIVSRKCSITLPVKALEEELDLDIYIYDDLSTLLIDKFEQNFFVSGSMGPPEFNMRTSMRLYYVHAWMEATGSRDIIHLENDNMIYFDALDVAKAAEKCDVRLMMQQRDPRSLILGTAFFRSATDLGNVLTWINDLLKNNPSPEMMTKVLGTAWMNDMTLFAKYRNDHKANGVDNVLTITPELPGEKGSKPGKKQSCMATELNMVFDNAAISIWNYGDFHGKKAHANVHAWGAYARLNAKKMPPPTFEEDDQGRKFPMLQYEEGKRVKIASLHMHSKQLEQVKS